MMLRHHEKTAHRGRFFCALADYEQGGRSPAPLYIPRLVGKPAP